MTWQDVKDNFSIEDIGAPLLANLAKGIYTPEAVLREYVQNAGDAYLDLEDVLKRQLAATEKQIDIYLQDGDTLAIQDSGIGMGLEEIRHYKRIALSPKMAKDRAGFRGIGVEALALFETFGLAEFIGAELAVRRAIRRNRTYHAPRHHGGRLGQPRQAVARVFCARVEVVFED